MYIFQIELPLRYNLYDLWSDKKDSSYIMGLTHDIKWQMDARTEQNGPISFTVTCGKTTDDLRLPEEHFTLKALNIVDESREKALAVVKPEIHRACMLLSFLLAEGNGNKHSFQPRIEPAYSEIKWSEKPCETEPKGDSYTDENGNQVIVIGSAIAVSVEMSYTIFGELNADDFSKLRDCRDEKLEFLLNEYYYALGEENVKSKFFHLFSIIEFIEKEYISLSGAKKLFTEKEIEDIKKHIKDYDGGLDKMKKERIINIISQKLTEATDIGRDGRLTAILHAMDIKEIKNCGTPFSVTKSLIHSITDMRNSLFHGDNGENDLTVERAVVMLMEINERVIDYVWKGIGLENAVTQ